MNQNLTKKLNRVDHTLPIYSPRSTYNLIRQNDELLLSDLTLNFDPFTINVLKNEFYIRNWEMQLIDFILVVKEHLLSWQTDLSNRDDKLIRCLINLFQEIDLNGNGTLEWDEFTNFIIEKATVLNNIKTKLEEIKSYTLSTTKLSQKFNMPISKVIYIPDIDRVVFFEEGSDTINLMNHETGLLNTKGLTVTPKPLTVEITSVRREIEGRRKDGSITIEKKETIIERKTMILDMLYIKDKKYQVLLTSSNDGFVRGWKYTSNGFILAPQPDNEDEMLEHHFKNDIYCMEWDGVNELLYCGQKKGQISIWNLKTDTEKSLKKEHKKVIMKMIAMPKLQFLASAALDGLLILWNTIEDDIHMVFREHKRGIVSLAFNESLILLFSAGFDHDIFVWNPYIDHCIYKISGHSCPLIGVLVIENTSQVVSMDSDGNVKVWDIKKFNCVQAFSVDMSDEKHRFNPQCIAYIPKPIKLVAAGRTISFFEYDKNYNPNAVDDNVALCAKFVKDNLDFLTPHGNKIKIWNALSGDVKKIYSDITSSDITAFILDFLGKRMLIGDSAGETAVCNVINGAKIKNLPKHAAEVTKIVHIYSMNLFVTASMDNTIKFSDDNKINESDLVKTIPLGDVLIGSLTFNPYLNLLMAGTHNGLLVSWEVETSKVNGKYHEQKDEEITSICPIDGIPYIIVSNAVGHISFVALPPLIFKYTRVFTYTNTDPENGSHVGIVNMVYCNETENMFIADDHGYIKSFDISGVIRLCRNQKNAAMESAKSKSFLTPPKIADIDIVQVWAVKAHQEQIKSVEYVQVENLLITTAFDRKVKIWNSTNGKYIDAFQQNYDKKDPRPIAYKRIGTDEIYNPPFTERIDSVYMRRESLLENIPSRLKAKFSSNASSMTNLDRKMEDDGKGDNSKKVRGGSLLKTKEEEDEEKKGIVDLNNDLNEKQKVKTNIYIKSKEEEFDPFYDYQKIEKAKIGNSKSNDWKLYINFESYYTSFEEKMKLVAKQLKKKEDALQEKTKRDGLTRRFNVNNFQETELPNLEANKRLFEEEEDNLKKEMESKKKKQENMKKIMDHNKKARDEMIIGAKMEKKNFKDVESKLSSTKLYKKELQGKLIEKKLQDVRLSKEECDSAYKLAAALSNYDKEDYRILKFLELKPRDNEEHLKVSRQKNFISLNKQRIESFMKDIEKLKMKNQSQNKSEEI